MTNKEKARAIHAIVIAEINDRKKTRTKKSTLELLEEDDDLYDRILSILEDE